MQPTHYALPQRRDVLECLHGFDQVVEGGAVVVAETICVEPAEFEGERVFTSKLSFGLGNASSQQVLGLEFVSCFAE